MRELFIMKKLDGRILGKEVWRFYEDIPWKSLIFSGYFRSFCFIFFVRSRVRRVVVMKNLVRGSETRRVRWFLGGVLIHCLWQCALVASDSDYKCRLIKDFLADTTSNENTETNSKIPREFVTKMNLNKASKIASSIGRCPPRYWMYCHRNKNELI